MTMFKTIATSTAIATMALAPAFPAFAQTEEQATPAIEDVSDAQVGAFVTAALAVAEMQTDWFARIEAAEDAEAQAALVEEANAAMEATVEETDGITLAEFIAIGEAAQTDQELSERIVAQMEVAAPEDMGDG